MTQLDEISKDDIDMEMTPMIDVVFLLLIFFMCTLKFKTLEGKLQAYLPKDVGVNQMDAEPIEKVEVMLRVRNQGAKIKPKAKAGDKAVAWNGNGRFIYDHTRDIEYKIGPRATHSLEELGRQLKDQFKKGGIDQATRLKTPATIDARQDVIYSDVIKVLDLTIEAGFRQITFVGAYPEKKPK